MSWEWALNSLWPSDAKLQHLSRSTLAQIMAYCLMAPSHYLNQCWFLMNKVLQHSPEGNFRVSAKATILYNEFENYASKLLPHLPGANELILCVLFLRYGPRTNESCSGYPGDPSLSYHRLTAAPLPSPYPHSQGYMDPSRFNMAAMNRACYSSPPMSIKQEPRDCGYGDKGQWLFYYICENLWFHHFR